MSFCSIHLAWFYTVLSLTIYFANSCLASYCTTQICGECCRSTKTGCINKQRYMITRISPSDRLFCQDCRCSDAINGCGWLSANENIGTCTSCSLALRMKMKIPELTLAGCESSALFFTNELID